MAPGTALHPSGYTEAEAQYMDLQRTGVQSILRLAFNPNVLTNTYLSNAVTIKAEYLRYDLGSHNLLVGSVGGPGVGYISCFRTEGAIARAGLNFKFGSYRDPVELLPALCREMRRWVSGSWSYSSPFTAEEQPFG